MCFFEEEPSEEVLAFRTEPGFNTGGEGPGMVVPAGKALFLFFRRQEGHDGVAGRGDTEGEAHSLVEDKEADGKPPPSHNRHTVSPTPRRRLMRPSHRVVVHGPFAPIA